MRLPPFFKDLPNDAVRRVVELLNQPQLVQTVKDAAQQIGATTEWGTSQVQDSMRQAKRWLDSMSARWKAAAPPSAIPVINGTGLLFSNDFALPPAETAANAAYSSAFAGVVDEKAVRNELEGQISQLAGAESTLVLHNVSAALFLLSIHPNAREGWVVPRVAGIRLPEGGDVFAIVRQCGTCHEVGTVNSLSVDEFQRALEPSPNAKGVLQLFPRRLDPQNSAGGQCNLDESVTELARKLGAMNVEVHYAGTLCELAETMPNAASTRQRLAAGADLVVLPGDMLLGGPRCAIVVGKRSCIEPMRRLAEAFGSYASPLASTMMLGALVVNQNEEAWKRSAIGEIISCSMANQINRAKRIALQLEGSTLVGSATVSEESLPIGGLMWSDWKLPTAVITITPKEDANSVRQQLSRFKRRILLNYSGSTVQIVMRSVDPADDREIVSAFGIFDEQSVTATNDQP